MVRPIWMLVCFGAPILALAPGISFAASNVTVFTPSPFGLISRVDPLSLRAERSVTSGTSGVPVVVSPDSQTFYTKGNSTLSAVNRSTGAITRNYQLVHTGTMLGLAVSPDNTRLYVGTCDPDIFIGGCDASYIEVFDVASARRLRVIDFGYEEISSITAAPQGNNFYVTHDYYYPCFDCAPGKSSTIGSNTLTVFSSATLQPIANLFLPFYPDNFVVSPDGRVGFGLAGNSIYEVDLTALTARALLTIPDDLPNGMTISNDGSTVAISVPAGRVYFLDTARFTLTAPVTTHSEYLVNTVALDSTGRYAFVTGGSQIERVDKETQSSTESDGNLGAVTQLTVAPDGSLFALQANANAVAQYTYTSNLQSRLLFSGSGPRWLALSPDAGFVYAACTDGITKTSTAMGRVVSQFLRDIRVWAVALSPDGSTVYAVAFENSGVLYVLNSEDGAQRAKIALPQGNLLQSFSIAVTPDGSLVYAMGGGNAAGVDTAANQVVATIANTGVTAMAVSPAGDVTYISNPGYLNPPTPAVLVVNTATQQTIGSIPIEAESIVFSPDGSRAYALGYKTSALFGVSVIDTGNRAVLAFLPVPNISSSEPFGQALAISPDGSFLYVGNTSSSALPGSIIDTATLTITGQFPAGVAIVTR